MSIAMEQLYAADKHSHAKKHLQAAWARSMKMSCMAWSIARAKRVVNDESAYLAGLMHDVGTLYIITKTSEFPELLGNPEGFKDIVKQWNPQIGKSIIESWGFNEEMAESADSDSYVTDNGAEEPRLADVMHVAELLIESSETESLDFDEIPSCRKLGVDDGSIGGIMERYRDKMQGMQSALN
jgi:HD-like signal output (HDOD) protein